MTACLGSKCCGCAQYWNAYNMQDRHSCTLMQMQS
jgi:hypothetical protein